MNIKLAAVAFLIALSSVACQTAEESTPGAQAIGLDPQTQLLVRVEGAQARSTGYIGSNDGQPIHRVLSDATGKVLFAYDLALSKSAAGGYRFLLKPVAHGPTFSTGREVTVMPHDVVRVELMERPDTGAKITDIFRLVETHQVSFGDHLLALHNRFFKWVHGE